MPDPDAPSPAPPTMPPPTAADPSAPKVSVTAEPEVDDVPATASAGPRITRRDALKVGAVALPCLAGSALFYDWLTGLTEAATVDDPDPILASYDPTEHRWGFVVDTRLCIGCGLCVVACRDENRTPAPEYTRTWVERQTTTVDGAVLVESPEAGIEGFEPEAIPVAVEGSPVVDMRFVSRLCMQCEVSPCTAVCPVGATYRTPDGVVLIDPDRCIGCGYCVVSCPYGARYIVPATEVTPRGVAGVADKCTFCYHRITAGLQPACVEACPVGSRQFGDLNDPDSPVSVALREHPTTRMKEDLGTKPRVYYIGLDGGTA